jgi:3-hydroxyacyl-CoA dehydrogenase/enoyl-CoA hydratase/3-hydroxybutyryl-CoA epimerase
MDAPTLRQFRVISARDGIIHLVFDAPGRTMNVFSEEAIHELGMFSDWLPQSDVRGVVIRSGKANAFCAGADLNELEQAYDMIAATPKELRYRRAFDHFFPISRALRKLECAGKPVAAAIAGLALGGGCELALAAHHRVMTSEPYAVLGLPEALVGLLPGGGGTQRLPRLIDLKVALPVLLDGKRLSAQEALAAGLAHQVVEPGREVEAAEDWVLSCNEAVRQPWDRTDWHPLGDAILSETIDRERQQVACQTGGHYPAVFAILDCLEMGLRKPFDEAMQVETGNFADLIQRREPRNMIRTLFLGRLAFDLLRKAGGPSEAVKKAAESVSNIWRSDARSPLALIKAGFGRPSNEQQLEPWRSGESFWHESAPSTVEKTYVRDLLVKVASEASRPGKNFSKDERLAADYLLATTHGFPSYLGSVFAREDDFRASH